MGFHELEENLIDMVKEQQAKLGFRPEVIRLYYPVSTLNHFFGTDDTPERDGRAASGAWSPHEGYAWSCSGDRKGDRFVLRSRKRAVCSSMNR